MSDERTEWVEWPDTADVPYEVLAAKVAEFCRELHKRELDFREDALKAALVVWPSLRAAIDEAGKKVGLNGGAQPIFPPWATEPVVALAGYYGKKPKTKQEAMEIAKRIGDDQWATLGELWLWVSDTGPIIERTLRKYGYLAPKEKKQSG